MCSEPTCFNRHSLCPNPQQHMNLTSEQIEPRMSRAVEAGMPVTYLNTTINAREQIEKLKKEIEMHEKGNGSNETIFIKPILLMKRT